MAIQLPALKAEPKYLKLAQHLRQRMTAGELQPGDRLPPYAELKEYGFGQNIVERAFAVLEQDNLIERRNGIGVFVADPQERRQTGVIAVANGFPHQHPYYVQLLQGVQAEAHRHQMEVLLSHAESRISWEKVDGVLICNPYSADAAHRLPPGMPRLALLHSRDNVSRVRADDYQGMSEAVEHLLQLGHRRIAFLGTGPNPNPMENDVPSQQRLAAYRTVLAAAGVKVSPDWMRAIHEPSDPAAEFVSLGREKMRRWLDEDWSTLGCTALLAQNDDTAIGAIEVLQDAGYKVPGDISVVGFDGSRLAEHFRPRLTTVEVPLYEIGVAGVKQLLEQIEMPLSELMVAPQAKTVTLPCRLKVGESTAPPSRV
jgi:DNA-binding LacI/PurR family transcriptional regulator